MKLKINEAYKYLLGEDIELNKEYGYFICIGELDEYYILHDFEKYCTLNGMDPSSIDDLDEYFSDVKELDNRYYKNINSLESIYYKNKEVEQKPKKKGRKFIKI